MSIGFFAKNGKYYSGVCPCSIAEQLALTSNGGRRVLTRQDDETSDSAMLGSVYGGTALTNSVFRWFFFVILPRTDWEHVNKYTMLPIL